MKPEQITSETATSWALLTDLYQLTMALGYFRAGLANRRAVFHWHYRREPFGGDYAIAAGHETVANYLDRWRFDTAALDYLSSIRDPADEPLFPADFLDYLGGLALAVDIDAAPEGTVVHAHTPVARVTGPLLQCQIIETPLLNILNFQTLVATKAARVSGAAGDEPVLEFGLRRAQGIDGALAASRAAYIGGCAATSNVLAGMQFGIPVRGTHAHSWVMCFDDELDSFRAYADAMPNNCVFLVDTYDTEKGVRRAIEVGRELRERGHELAGVRLDSGDLAALSKVARQMLDDAGFPGAKVVASNDLDEHAIAELKRDGAQIAVWGVGTKLTTAYDQPALGGVYKLSALERESGDGWDYRVKLSEQPIKISTPGQLQVRRFELPTGEQADLIYDTDLGPSARGRLFADATVHAELSGASFSDLLQPFYRAGARVGERPSLPDIRARAAAGRVHRNVYLEDRLADLRTELIDAARAR